MLVVFGSHLCVCVQLSRAWRQKYYTDNLELNLTLNQPMKDLVSINSGLVQVLINFC
jgi:hypothetical protein